VADTEDRNAQTIADNLEAWATWIRNYTLTMRVGTGKLHEAPDQLRDAAAYLRELPVEAPKRTGRCGMGMDRQPLTVRVD
jgi:hypothetical protein